MSAHPWTARDALVLVTDLRLSRDHEALVPPLDAGAFARYRSAHDGIVLVARTSRLPAADGPRLPTDVDVQPTPDFRGLASLIRVLPTLVLQGWHVPRQAAVLVRMPSVTGIIFAAVRRLRRRPYAAEVAGDLAGVLASGAVGALPRVLAPLGAVVQRWVVHGAAAVVYVTPRALQTRYPPSPSAVTASVSDVQLDAADFGPPRQARATPPWRLIAVGSQDRSYKGLHLLLDALTHLISLGAPVTLDLVGDGRLNPTLRAQAKELGLEHAVRFHGRVTSRPRLHGLLDDADVFVMPSLTEGFPRALLEAMARGLPAVVSDVGGMPDIIDADLCVPAGDARQLALALERLLSDPVDMARRGSKNHERAASFTRGLQARAMLAWFDSWAST